MVKKNATRVFLKNLSLFCASVIIALIVGEYVTRYYFRDITTTSCNSSYFAIRWARENVRLNSWWFRDKEMVVTKPKGVIRIAVIGDSITYGQGIREEDRFTNQIEDHLTSGHRADHYEVLNFGWLGSETIDHFNVFKNTVIKVNPDFILLQWSINDVEGYDKSGRPEPIPLLPFDSLHSYLYQNSAFYYLLDLRWQTLIQSIGLSSSYESYLLERFGDPECQETIKYIDLLREFIGACKEQEIPLGLILFPNVVPDLAGSYPFRYLHDLVRGVCDQEGIPCIDLLDTYAQYEAYKELWVNRFDNHPSPLAHRLAAEKILEKFGETWQERALNGKNAVTSTIEMR